MRTERGFTLMTLLMTLTFGSLMLLATFKAFSHFQHQLSTCHQRYLLAHTLAQLLDKISKDLKRAGFAYQTDAHSMQRLKQPPLTRQPQAPLMIGHHPGEAAGSCVLIYYDRNRIGFTKERHAPPTQRPAETFGYRLHHGNLECQQGVTDCGSSRWEDLLDEHGITVQHFQVLHQAGAPWVQLTISAYVTGQPAITTTLQAAVMLENLP